MRVVVENNISLKPPSSGSGLAPVPMDDSVPAADGEAEQPPAEREELSDP